MKKLFISLLVLFLVLSGCTGNKKVTDRTEWSSISNEEQKSFDEWQRKWFVDTAKESYSFMRFNIKDPKAYGIEEYTPGFGEVFEDDATKYKEKLAELLKFDKSKLNKDQQLSYDSVKFTLEKEIAILEMEDDYSFAFTPNSGLNNNLITNLTEFVIRNEQDVKEFIQFVADASRVIEEGIKLTREQAEKGFVQNDVTIDSIIEQVSRFLSSGSDNEILVAFKDKASKLNLANYSDYEQELTSVVNNSVIPSYRKIAEMYAGLKGKCSTLGRLYDYKDGTKYYELYIADRLGDDTNPNEIAQVMEDAAFTQLQNILAVVNSVDIPSGYAPEDVYELMEALKNKSAVDFEPLKEVSYTIDFLNPTVTSDNVAAYYVSPPYDAPTDNVIKVNPTFSENDPDGLASTLAHEGYPGHLYQNVYYMQKHPNSEIRQVVSYLGYGEGWAQYAGLKSYEYFLTDEKAIQYLQSYDQFSYYSYAYLDIMIHYNGWNKDDCIKFYEQFFQPETAKNVGSSIYDANVGDPGVFLPYAWGMYQMVKYHEEAKSVLGKKYSGLALNKLIADVGNVPLFLVEEEVKAFIKENK